MAVRHISVGSLHVGTAAKIAASVCRDNCTMDAIHRFAALQGNHDRNAERALNRWFKGLFGNGLSIYNIFVEVEKGDGVQKQVFTIPTICIWELLHCLHRAGRMQFGVSMLGA